MSEHHSAEEILSFWFGELDEAGRASPETAQRWFKGGDAFDHEVESNFLFTYEKVRSGELDDWRSSARGTLASIITLDQFPRNMFRNTTSMYATDELAATLSAEGITRGFDCELKGDERCFFYMPLMHSEVLANQNRCVEVFEAYAKEDAESRAETYVNYAVSHRDIVARFGRFPHRNEILDRVCTEEEEAFLKEPGSSF